MKRWLALALLVALPVAAQDRFPRCRSAQGRSDRGFACDPGYSFFEFAPASGAGLGAPCACAAVTGAKGETVVFSRSSVGYCTKADYSLTLCSANQPRVMPGRPGVQLGLLGENDATNLVTQNSDLAQAVWTKSASMTCVKNATDPAGVASGASTCTASAATQTVTQALVRVSSDNSASAYMKRVTGSGVVEVTNDGTTWTAITSGLTTSWKRVVCRDVEGCMGGNCIVVPAMCATSANPTVGFRIQTSGDAVAIAKVQNELTLRPSSPIDTSASTATRTTDTAYVDVPTIAAVGCVAASSVGSIHYNNEYFVIVSNGAAAPFTALYSGAPPVDHFNNVGCLINPSSATASTATNFVAGGLARYACGLTAGTNSAVSGGYLATNVGGALSGATRVYIGGAWTGSGSEFQGVTSGVMVDPSSTRCLTSQVSPAATHIAWLGDSITHGIASAPTYPVVELYRTYGMALSKSVQDQGYPGYGVTNLPQIWTSIRGYGWGSLIVLFGVNDLRVGTTAATIWAGMQPILDDAKALGARVTVVRVTPWGAYTQWTAGKQTETDSLWTLQQAWCTANSMPCVDTSSLGTGNNLQAGFDSGDGLHPNSAGAAALVALVKAANP